MNVGQASADSTSSLLLTAQGKGRLTVRNLGPNTVFLGRSGVSITTGLHVKIDEEVVVGVSSSEAVHAVCAAAETATVSYDLSWIY